LITNHLYISYEQNVPGVHIFFDKAIKSELYDYSKSIPTKNLNNKYERPHSQNLNQTQTSYSYQLYLPLLRPGISLLLALSLRLPYLSGVYA